MVDFEEEIKWSRSEGLSISSSLFAIILANLDFSQQLMRIHEGEIRSSLLIQLKYAVTRQL